MVQTKRKTNVIALAIVMSLVFVFGIVAALFAAPATETAYAGTATIDSLSLANINAGNAQGKYGNFSWDKSKIKSISASEMLTDRDEDPLCIVWTRPTNGAYASALTFSVNVTDSVGAITIRYDDATVPSYISPGEKQSGTLTETVNSLYTTYEKIYFYISCSYMYNDVHLTSVSIQIKATTYKMTFTKGTGIKDAYLSTNSTATSGSASGTEYAKYSTVSCFAKLADGYKAQNGWTLIDGTANSEDAIYRVGTRSNISAAYNFGTIDAAAKTKSLTRNTNGAGYMSNLTLTYGQTANLTVPTRNGYNFLGWNTKADGTGATYGNESSATLTASQVNAIIDDSSINTVYAMWRIGKDTVIGFINDIPDPVVYTQACKDAIDTARGGYENLSAEDKDLVTNYDKLTEAESIYAGMQSDKEALDAYKITKKTDANSLAESGDSDACGTLITNAKQAIDDIVYDCTKTLAENKEMVDDIISALESDLYNQRQADGVAEYIDAISNPVTLASKPDINTARALYNGLYDNQKSRVSNYHKLTDAEAAYAVVELIDVIEAPITSEDEETIEAAREAYDDLDEAQQDLVGNIDDLLDAEAALAVAKLIEAIEEPITSDDEEAIEAAREAYDDLDEDQQDLVGNYDDLTDAEAALAVAKLIDAIDEAITAEDEETIEAAREAFDALPDGQRVLVGNINDLTDAEEALAVAKLIEAIEAPITQEDEEAIEAAREAFDALTEDQQDLVGNIDDLLDVEVTYVEVLIEEISDPVTLSDKEAIEKAREFFDELPGTAQDLVENRQDLYDAEAAYKVLDDEAKANAVKELIDAIGTVEYTEDSKDKIDAAKEAFDALTYDQKALLENTDEGTLTDAVTTYEVLHENHVAAAEVIALIEQIGTVEYTETSKNKIDTAKDAYGDLTDDQKALVDAYLTENEVDEITVSETIYIDLGNQQKAKDVKDLINAIGEVKYPDSKDAIEAARAGYNGLTETQKTLVDNYETLTAAEVRFAELEKTPALSGGAIAGIVIGSAAFLSIIGLLVCFLLKRKKERKKITNTF